VSHLQLVGISKIFEKIEAVRKLSLEVGRGEIICILGPSGCGKTTTLRMIAGLEIPTSGTILAGGRDLTRVPARDRNIGLVFQNYALFPHLNVFENVAFGLRARKQDNVTIQKRVREVLDRVQLGEYDRRAVHALSGGQQQRVALARALAIGPEVLLLDEPLSNLDPSLREDMRDQIRSVIDDLKVTTVFVTHDQGEAFALADRIAIMSEGICRQVGRPDEVYSRPADAFVAKFLGKTNLLSARVTQSANGKSILKLAAGFTLEASVPEHVSDSAYVFVRPENVLIAESGHTARVVSARFEGPVVEYTVEVAGVQITARQFHHGKRPLAAGDEVHIQIPSGQFHVLDDDAE
jgi:ABC-type Fe3+/spermidine/putrescine transport system ATPase subunit